jgi:hypothetical protein
MLRSFLIGISILMVFVPPQPVRVRFRLHPDPATGIETSRMQQALERGLFRDSLIAQARTADSVNGQPLRRTALVEASVTGDGSQVRICTVVLNILLRTVAGPDTVRVSPTAIDSALSESGAHYAKVLAEARWPAKGSDRCT